MGNPREILVKKNYIHAPHTTQKNSITGTILIRTITLCIGLHHTYT